ncbi:hydrolase [Mesonia sp. HuA40]|uniref:hydrolase n=1 Tax=Mesonia sp. HuA40 TaxID=2602761 RepID=UPI0011D9DDFE|nr:hydrolase [Mesonia sp. HuA40]TXK74749.1 hydrolase [Mesonia sp. HuA40]
MKITELKDERDEALLLRDSIMNLQTAHQERFTLQSNDKARMYVEDLGFEATELAQLLEQKIVGANAIDQDNPYVPYQGLNGVMRINSVKVLNHKWVIAEFTDGTYWGEVLLNYFINEDQTIDIEMNNGLLYAN